jgi:hypothetical protein
MYWSNKKNKLTRNTNRVAVVALLLLALQIPTVGAWADASASALLARLKETGATRIADADDVQILILPDQLIVVIAINKTTDKELAACTKDIAKALASLDVGTRSLTILFNIPPNTIKEAQFDSGQLRSLWVKDESVLSNVVLANVDHTGTSALRSSRETLLTAGAMVTSTARQDYASERSKVVARIEKLKQQAVGVAPFVNRLAKIDESFEHSNVEAALESLSQLDESLLSQEQAVKALHEKTDAGRAPAVSNEAPNMRNAAQKGQSQATRAATGPSVSEFNDANSLFKSFVSSALGAYVPHEGPFLMARIQIAKRIRELESAKQDVRGYTSMFRSMDDLAIRCRKDPRLNPSLASDVKYLQSQLGLTELQGNLKHLDAFK